jgi:hypothetical protein
MGISKHSQAERQGIEGGMTVSEAAEESRARLVVERRFADLRLAALARAVREHEGTIRGPAQRSRPQDRRLYKRLRDICSERLGQ